jgi:hypothetical protein
MILSRGGGGFFKKKLQREKGGNIEWLRGKTLELIKREATIIMCSVEKEGR